MTTQIRNSFLQLCVVTLALFDTLLSLNNEDLVVALVLKYLLPCHHVPLAHKRKINETEPYLQASEYFINLSPEIMKLSHAIAAQSDDANTSLVHNSWNNYGLNITDSLYSDYYAYTYEAHHKIAQCRKVVDRWTNKYQKYQKRRDSNEEPNISSCSEAKKGSNSSQRVQMIKQILEELDGNGLSTSSLSSPTSASENETRNKLHDSLQSIGESSGYESFRYRPDEDEQSEGSETIATSKMEDVSVSSGKVVVEPWKISSRKIEDTLVLESAEDLFTAGTVNLGEFFEIFDAFTSLLTFPHG